jgi:hypothetical protein
MEPDNSGSGPYPELHESNRHSLDLFPIDPFLYYPTIYA